MQVKDVLDHKKSTNKIEVKTDKVKQLKGIAEVWNKTHADYRSKIKRINITIEHKTHHTAVGSYEDGVVSLYSCGMMI